MLISPWCAQSTSSCRRRELGTCRTVGAISVSHIITVLILARAACFTFGRRVRILCALPAKRAVHSSSGILMLVPARSAQIATGDGTCKLGPRNTVLAVIGDRRIKLLKHAGRAVAAGQICSKSSLPFGAILAYYSRGCVLVLVLSATAHPASREHINIEHSCCAKGTGGVICLVLVLIHAC